MAKRTSKKNKSAFEEFKSYTLFQKIIIVIGIPSIFLLLSWADDYSDTNQDDVYTAENTPKSTPRQDYYTAENTPKSTPSNEDSRSEKDVYADQLRCSNSGYNEYYDYSAEYQGIVYNDGNSDIYRVKVNMNFYDSDGNFIGNDFTYLQPMDIRAGGKGTFDATALDLSSEFDGECELASIEYRYEDF